MQATQLFTETLVLATKYIDKVRPDSFHQATPNAEWDVRELAAHMLYELCWSAEIIAGKTPKEVGDVFEGDLIGDALQANWHAAAEKAIAAVKRADFDAKVHVSHGRASISDYLREVSADLLIHTWDLGEGIAEPVQFEERIIREAHDYLKPRIGELEKRGMFAPPIVVPDAADAQTKLLALTGRRVNWPIV